MFLWWIINFVLMKFWVHVRTFLRFCQRPGAVHFLIGAAVVLLMVVPGCTDMYDNQKMKPLEESRFFPDHLSARPPVEGTVPRGHTTLDEHLYTGKVGGKFVDQFPFPITAEILKRGHDRFDIFCSPCHGRLGDGSGMIVQRGFPKPNSFSTDSVAAKAVGQYFDVITNGFGRMYSYAPSIPVDDRWAIVAYIRALQYSRHVPVADLKQADRAALK